MSADQNRTSSPPSPTPGRVRQLNVDFETLSFARTCPGGYDPEVPYMARTGGVSLSPPEMALIGDTELSPMDLALLGDTGDHRSPGSESGSDAEESLSSDGTRKVVFTGENRIPYRERLQKIRRAAEERAKRRSGSGTIEAKGSPPRTPPRTPPSLEPFEIECPGAPRKVNKFLDARRLSDSESDETEDDYVDEEQVATKRLLLDSANERHRKGITKPASPSPLRRSFNAEDMEKFGPTLDFMRAELDEHKTTDDASAGRDGESPKGDSIPSMWI
ncbi:hypothetical protein F4677DRAFT_460627 [Hypoxylon crocopeplum]|nr:hypothetical protein F4677DRAFT_460627 [Hypoxylon crocopeplum]